MLLKIVLMEDMFSTSHECKVLEEGPKSASMQASKQACKRQPQMEGSLMGMSQVADNPFDMSVPIP